ncbi:hypothetical protein AYO38_02520 [bacterium SCGC AG-212-C10]|nr:hypothetical protein AYO38_02520 [bacterium SCGC AG-212-C10]
MRQSYGVATIDLWDEQLEAMTANLVAMAEGRGTPCGVRTDNGWRVVIGANKSSATIELTADAAADPGLDDYELVVIYGLSFHVPKPWPATPTFRKRLTLQDGYSWEEQTLREVVLETLGLVRHVLHATTLELLPAGSVAVSRGPKRPFRRR